MNHAGLKSRIKMNKDQYLIFVLFVVYYCLLAVHKHAMGRKGPHTIKIHILTFSFEHSRGLATSF